MSERVKSGYQSMLEAFGLDGPEHRLIWDCPKCSKPWWKPDFWRVGKEVYCLSCTTQHVLKEKE